MIFKMKRTIGTILSFGLFSLNALAQSPYIQAVDEYVPAPGQFVNTLPTATADDTPATMAQKCTEAIAAGKNGMITLGAYGGYITFHFDHPIVNVEGKRDFAVWGNAFENNAEPAIVMVSVDTNHNKQPDDEWYELKGSEYDKTATIHNYQLTYTYSGENQNVGWADNQGQTGSIPRNKYHKQEYFPLWLANQTTLSFTGSRLPNNAYYVDASQTWFLPAFDYGYADNQPNTNKEGCSFDIAWAVDNQGQPVALSHIDFVRCYNAVNQVCGSIGETSTEITGAEDLHPEAATGISQTAFPENAPSVFGLHGKRFLKTQRGINIIRYDDGTTKKIIIK